MAGAVKSFDSEEGNELILRARRLSGGIYNLIQHLKRSPNKQPNVSALP